MKIDIITIFPKMFTGPFRESIVARAQKKSLVEINIHNLRDWTKDKHKSVDDQPFGGGPGMIMRVDIVDRAVTDISKQFKKKIILLTPQGKPFTQKKAQQLSKLEQIILICGHYEGVDERIRTQIVDEEISIGDYVLSGGELAAMVVTDTVVRLIPGVLGQKDSLKEESFSPATGGLEYPQYTRPAEYKKLLVPKILLSGNHQQIKTWRQKQSLKRTKDKRPDLLATI